MTVMSSDLDAMHYDNGRSENTAESETDEIDEQDEHANIGDPKLWEQLK